MSLTRQLTRAIRARPIADGDLRAAALFVLDTLACAYAARSSAQGRLLLDWYRAEPRDVARRAFLFGALVHVLEMDDLHRESVTHPGCVVIPAAWAAAARKGADGPRFLAAVLQGYEAVCRIGNAVGAAHYRIWHNTATCGPFGSAFAVASLTDLDEEQTVCALGNAGTQASGLWQFLEEGAMSKHLHAGRAAESGMVAAELAARGFTGPARILEGSKGFFAAACPDAEPARVLASPEARWQLELTSIKPWPSCRHTHPAIEAALELHGRVSPDEVASVHVETYQAALDLCDAPIPTSVYGAKFSLHHCVAAALAEGTVTLDSFDADARERLAPLRQRTSVARSAPFDDGYPAQWGARVTVTTTGPDRAPVDDRARNEAGREARSRALVAHRSVCKGDPESPVDADAMRSKAAMLLGYAGLPDARAAELSDAVLDLPRGGSLPPIDDLFA